MGLGEPQPMPGTVGQPVQIVEAFEAEAVGGVGGWPPLAMAIGASPAAGAASSESSLPPRSGSPLRSADWGSLFGSSEVASRRWATRLLRWSRLFS